MSQLTEINGISFVASITNLSSRVEDSFASIQSGVWFI